MPTTEADPKLGLDGDKPKDGDSEGQIKALRAEAEKHRKEAADLKAWRAEREAKDAEADKAKKDAEAQAAADKEAKERDELLKAQKFDELMTQERAEREKLKAEFDKRLKERDEAVLKEHRRAMKVELLAKARELGMHDPADITTFIRVSDLKENDDGEIEGLDEKFAGLKESKPYLFKDEKSTREEARKSLGAPPARNGNSSTSKDYSTVSTADFRKEMSEKYGLSM